VRGVVFNDQPVILPVGYGYGHRHGYGDGYHRDGRERSPRSQVR
jgi:hypothetical protein